MVPPPAGRIRRTQARPALMHIPGYSLDQEIYRGRKRVVWRARRQRDGATLIVKTLTDDFPSPSDTAGLRREFEILRSFTAPGIARAVDLESHRDRLTLVLEDAGDMTLQALVASGSDLARGPVALRCRRATRRVDDAAGVL